MPESEPLKRSPHRGIRSDLNKPSGFRAHLSKALAGARTLFLIRNPSCGNAITEELAIHREA